MHSYVEVDFDSQIGETVRILVISIKSNAEFYYNSWKIHENHDLSAKPDFYRRLHQEESMFLWNLKKHNQDVL